VTVIAGRLIVRLHFLTVLGKRQEMSEECWLDSAAPLSVIPFHVHAHRLRWQQIPRVQMTWLGQPCDLGQIDVWLPTEQPPYLRGPLPLLAKFPRSDLPGVRVPVLLGLEFFLAYQAGLNLPPPPQPGAILVP
jgi:hypothetical protein